MNDTTETFATKYYGIFELINIAQRKYEWSFSIEKTIDYTSKTDILIKKIECILLKNIYDVEKCTFHLHRSMKQRRDSF